MRTIGTNDGRFGVAMELEKKNAWRDGLNADKIFTDSRRDKETNTTDGGARCVLGCRRSNELVGACIMILNGDIGMEEAMFLDGNNINFGGFGTMG